MAVTPIGFPLTYDPALDAPKYSASDFRLTAGAACAVPDGSAFGGVQGIRAGSPAPLVTIDGTTVTVAAHMGWLSPWKDSASYTYALPGPMQVEVGSTSGSYKIAVVLDDEAAGHGTGEKVRLLSCPSYTPDSQIPGLVVGRVDAGVASDTAPVLSMDATLRVRAQSQLDGLTAADGVSAVLSDGSRYEMRSGSWALVSGRTAVPAWKTSWWEVMPIRLTRIDDVVVATTRITRLQGSWTGDNGNEITGKVPEPMRPDYTQWVYLDGRYGLYLSVGADGRILFGRDRSRSYSALEEGQRIEIQTSWHVA